MSDRPTTNAINDGGPAFPSEGFTGGAGGLLSGSYIKNQGMSLRDLFAAHAAQGLVAAGRRFGVGKDAYAIADDLIAAMGGATSEGGGQ